MILYRLLVSLASLPVLIRLAWRVLRGRETGSQVNERLGGGAAVPGALWLHAASNGELASARPLIEALMAADPELQILITTNTATAQAMADGWGVARITARMAPLDHRLVLHRFLTRHRPKALVVIENELWPNRLAMLSARNCPIAVIGARMSDRSATRWAKTRLGRQMIAQIGALSAQDGASEARYLALGLAPERLLPRTNLKTAVTVQQAMPLNWDRHGTVLAASTHEGEDGPILHAFAKARAQRPELRLILAPRHPRRAPAIAGLIAAAGLRHTARSTGDDPDAEVYLADTMGEMASWYASAGICFVGGSLVAKGGHTPYEPAAFDCAILHGPDVANFADAYAALDGAGGALACRDAEALSAALQALDGPRQAQMAGAARAALGPPADIPALAEALRARL